MTTEIVKFQKEISTLPAMLSKDTLYFLRTGDGFDFYLSDNLGQIAHKLNSVSGTVTAQVRNETGSTLSKGQVVYLSGVSENKPLALLAQANAESTSSGTFGIVSSNIGNNNNGTVVVIGEITGLNTSSLTEGNPVYLSPNIAGFYTQVKPVAPNHSVYLGIVTRSHTNQGSIQFKVQNGYELGELHDVVTTGAVTGDILVKDSDTIWRAKSYIGDMSLLSETISTLTIPTSITGASSLLHSEIGSSYSYAQYSSSVILGNYLLYRIDMTNGDVSNMFMSPSDNWGIRSSITTWDNTSSGAALVGSATPDWAGSLIIGSGETNLVDEILKLQAINLDRSWIYYAAQWDVAPTVVGESTAPAIGTVRQYILDGVTRYRLTPTNYSPLQDAFYTTFSAGVCSGLIVARA